MEIAFEVDHLLLNCISFLFFHLAADLCPGPNCAAQGTHDLHCKPPGGKSGEDLGESTPFLPFWQEVWRPLTQLDPYARQHPLFAHRGAARAGALPVLARAPEWGALDEFARIYAAEIKSHVIYNFDKRVAAFFFHQVGRG